VINVLKINKIHSFFHSWRVADARVVGENSNNGWRRFLPKLNTNNGLNGLNFQKKSMKFKITYFTLFLLTNLSVFALDRGSDKVIKKYFKAVGGVENWRKVESIRMIKHIYSDEFWYNTTIANGQGLREEFHPFNSPIPTIDCVNPKEGWRAVNGVSNDDSLNAAYIKGLGTKNRIDTLSKQNYKHLRFISLLPWLLLDYQQKGITAKAKDKVNIDVVGNVIEVEFNLGEEILGSCFFSVSQGYLVKIAYGNREHFYSDFRTVGSVILPFNEITQTVGETFLYSGQHLPVMREFITTQIVLNEKIRNNFFDKPMN
jgi:hypothetical protein